MPFLWESQTEAFCDCAPLHLLTTGTLTALQRRLPDSEIHQARFRPNLLVETNADGFIENDWVNKHVTFKLLMYQVYDDIRRCVMFTRSQEDLPCDTKVIRTIVKSNNANVGFALKSLGSSIV
jgi:uncharacterized protein YcbX